MSLRRFAHLLLLSNGRRLQRGFSLVELVIAVAVIGLLTAVAIPSYGNFQQSTRQQALEEQVTRAHDASLVALQDGTGSAAIARVVDSMNQQTDVMLLGYSGTTRDELCVTGEWKDTSLRVASVKRGAGCEPTAAKPPATETPATPTPTPTVTKAPVTPTPTVAPTVTPTTPPVTSAPSPSPQLPIEGSGTATRGNLTVSAQNEDKWPQGYRLSLGAVMANNPKLSDTWTVSWPDPLATSASGSGAFTCEVAGGVVTCKTIGWIVDAFKWNNTASMGSLSIQIQSSNGYTSPNRPKLSLK